MLRGGIPMENGGSGYPLLPEQSYLAVSGIYVTVSVRRT